AIKRLWSNIGTYSVSLVRYVASGGSENSFQTSSGEPITGRDVIALLATLGIDLGIFAMAVLNPIPGERGRYALTGAYARLNLPSDMVTRQLQEAIETAIARAPGDHKNFDWVSKHFIHHNGASYFVIPNLYSVEQNDKDKDVEQSALAMNQLAGVLDDLKL